MAKSNLTDTQQVEAHIQQLDAETGRIVQKLRVAILAADKHVSEHIKWNSPAFYYNGEMKAFDAKEYKRDILVINLHRGKILLVFPTGERIQDNTGLLEGAYTDGRRMISIKDIDDATAKLKGLQGVIKNWLKGVEK
ncbi:MAG: DUF1801 domain-containing protein [Chitinophagaceae bacterium]|nr:MAG: DUF1801 domain-containing protein [Chitinophagaceae bacterium]